MQRLDPKLDVVFKLLLTREPALLRDMLECILAKPIHALTLVDPSVSGELASDKRVVFDIRAQLDDGSRADIEMQLRIAPTLASRLFYYGARDYADQLAPGDDYDLLAPTVIIVWLVSPLFPALDRLHSIFELRERHTHTRFGDQLAIHLLQLSALSPPHPTRYHDDEDGAERWARFFTAYNDEAELDRLIADHPIMTLAKQNLDELSQDPTARRIARERADEIKLYNIDLLASRAEGKTEGKTEGETKGRADILLKLIGLRFGPPAAATRARIAAATLEQLDTWAERVLTAQTLEELLAP